MGTDGYDYRITTSKDKKWVPVGAGPLKSHFLRFTNSGCQWVLVGASGCQWVPVGASGCQWVYFRSSPLLGLTQDRCKVRVKEPKYRFRANYC